MKPDQRKLLLFGGLGLGALFLLSRSGAAAGSPAMTADQLLAAGLTPDQIRQAAGYPQVTVSQAMAWGYPNAFVGARITKPGDPSGIQYVIVPG